MWEMYVFPEFRGRGGELVREGAYSFTLFGVSASQRKGVVPVWGTVDSSSIFYFRKAYCDYLCIISWECEHSEDILLLCLHIQEHFSQEIFVEVAS